MVKEKDKRFKDSASCFGIVPIVPMFLKHISHLELFGSEHPLSSPRYLPSHLIYSKIFRLFLFGSHFKASIFKSELNFVSTPSQPSFPFVDCLSHGEVPNNSHQHLLLLSIFSICLHPSIFLLFLPYLDLNIQIFFCHWPPFSDNSVTTVLLNIQLM